METTTYTLTVTCERGKSPLIFSVVCSVLNKIKQSIGSGFAFSIVNTQ